MTIIIILQLFGIFYLLGETTSGQEINFSANSSFSRINKSLSRKKRFLAFPTGSAFVATLTLLKAIQVKEPSNWNLDLEFDMIWPIPNQETIYRRPQKRAKGFRRTRRHRRDLYTNIELALISQGLPGKKCILRTICEANNYLNRPGVSFIDDILRVILSHEEVEEKLDHYDIAYRKKENCHLEYPCPFSLLNLLYNYEPQLFV